jgi:hypothetical protein
MPRATKVQIVHYVTLRNLEIGELIKAWPFLNVEEADQKRKYEYRKNSGGILTTAWIESLDTQVESYPPRFKKSCARKATKRLPL